MTDPIDYDIKTLLSIPPLRRSEKHVELIKNYVMNVKFFCDYKDKPEFKEICRNIYLRDVDRKITVFHQGDPGDALYVILEGSVSIYVNTQSEIKHFSYMREVMTLNNGDFFGELALIHDSLRSATVITNEKSIFMILEKSIFRRVLSNLQSSQVKKITDFYSKHFRFRNLPEKTKGSLITHSFLKRYPPNTVIARQGDQAKAIYHILSGRVKLVKSINQSFVRSDYKSNPEIRTDKDAEVLLELEELDNYDSFCETEILSKEAIACSAITTLVTELIFIWGFDLKSIFSNEEQELYKNSIMKYPTEDDIGLLYSDMNLWSKYRAKEVENIQIKKFNKKSFSNKLRSPFLRLNKMKPPTMTFTLKTDVRIPPQTIERIIKKDSLKFTIFDDLKHLPRLHNSDRVDRDSFIFNRSGGLLDKLPNIYPKK